MTDQKDQPAVPAKRGRGRVVGEGKKFDDKARARYLEVLAQKGIKHVAFDAVSVCALTVANYRKEHPEFVEAEQEAYDKWRFGVLEKTAFERAIEGWEEPVYYKGMQVGTKRVFDQALIAKLLDAHIPERYGKNVQPDGVGTGGGVLLVPYGLSVADWIRKHSPGQIKDITPEMEKLPPAVPKP